MQFIQALLPKCPCLNSATEDSLALAFQPSAEDLFYTSVQISSCSCSLITIPKVGRIASCYSLTMVQLGLAPSSLSFFRYLFSSCSSLGICLVVTFVFFSGINFCIFSIQCRTRYLPWVYQEIF